MESADFIRIIFTELANQDPFQPSDSSALLDQLNSIRSIESDIDLMEGLKSLVFENQLASASSFLGKHVEGLTDSNQRVAGTVTAVLRQGDTITLELDDGWRIPIDRVELIVQPQPQPQPAPPGDEPPVWASVISSAAASTRTSSVAMRFDGSW